MISLEILKLFFVNLFSYNYKSNEKINILEVSFLISFKIIFKSNTKLKNSCDFGFF